MANIDATSPTAVREWLKTLEHPPQDCPECGTTGNVVDCTGQVCCAYCGHYWLVKYQEFIELCEIAGLQADAIQRRNTTITDLKAQLERAVDSIGTDMEIGDLQKIIADIIRLYTHYDVVVDKNIEVKVERLKILRNAPYAKHIGKGCQCPPGPLECTTVFLGLVKPVEYCSRCKEYYIEHGRRFGENLFEFKD